MHLNQFQQSAMGFGFNNAPLPGQLPYDPNQQQVADYPLNTNPPPVPAIQTHPALMPAVPGICAALINQIQIKKAQSHLSMFLFNQMAQNGYQNDEFRELFYIAVETILSALETGQSNDAAAVTYQIVPEIVGARAAANLRFFPALAQYVQPHQQQVVQQAMNYFAGLAQRAQQRISARQQSSFGVSGGAVVGGQSNFGTMAPSLASAVPTTRSGLFDTGPAQPQVAVNTNFGGQNDAGQNRWERQLAKQRQLEQERQAEQARQVEQNTSFGRNLVARQAIEQQQNKNLQPFKARSPIETVLDTSVSSSQQTTPVQSTVQATNVVVQKPQEDTGLMSEADLKARGLCWKRTARQPYHPAWDLNKQVIRYTVMDGEVIAVLVNRKENTVQESEHSLAMKYFCQEGPAPAKPEAQVTVTNLTDIPEIRVHQAASETLELCENAAQMQAAMAGRVGGHLSAPDTAYRRFTYICEPLVADTADTAKIWRGLARSLERSDSYQEAAALLKGMTAATELQLRNRLNERLTGRVNEILTLRLGLEKVRITDFCEDILPLVENLRTHMGSIVAQAMLDARADIISSSCHMLSDDECFDFARELNDFELVGSNTDEKKKEQDEALRCIVFFGSRVSHTLMALRSFELNLSLTDKSALLLTEQVAPALYGLAKNLFESKKDASDSFAAHYFVTADGVRLQVARGLLNKDGYLVQLKHWC